MAQFDLRSLLADRRGEGPQLHARYLNKQMPRMLHTIGFDKVYERAEGAYLVDGDGNRYLDTLAGFGVHALGHNHPAVRQALQDMLSLDLADMVQFDCPLLAGLLAEQLLAKAPGLERVYFCNSGTEAVEAALKLAHCATGRPRILYCDHAFHGLTAGSLSVNGSDDFRSGFGPLLPGTRIPLGDLDALQTELRKGGVAALIVEPIQGKGVWMPPAGFLTAASELLHKHGALLICDEVQTGLGRTGRFFAYQHEEAQPDIVTVAKALSGGIVPVGAVLATDRIFGKVWSSMSQVMRHDSTFGGNTAAMAVGLTTLAVIDHEHLISNAHHTGTVLSGMLRDLAAEHGTIAEIRGRGLMIGIQFRRPRLAPPGLLAQSVAMALFQRHRILTQVAGARMDVIKLTPPLTISGIEAGEFLKAFGDVIGDGGLLARSALSTAWHAVGDRRRKG